MTKLKLRLDASNSVNLVHRDYLCKIMYLIRIYVYA